MRRNSMAILTLVAALLTFGAGIRVVDHLMTHQQDLAQWQGGERPSLIHLLEQPLEAQVGDFRGFQKTFTTQTATGATSSSATMRGIAVLHTIELITTGSPTGCTYRLQGTRDSSTWFNISASDITCTSTTVSFEANKPAVQVRGNLLTLTAGTSPTVTLKYIGR